jgi:inner membrane organizing system protein 1
MSLFARPALAAAAADFCLAGRAFPVWLGTGFGLGSGYTDCERSFAPVAVPGVRIVPSSSPEKGKAPATTLERLSQKAGEGFGALKEKAKDASSEGVSKAKELKEEVASKVRQV